MNRLKRRLILYQEFGTKLGFDKEKLEAQVNKYLETLQALIELKNKLKKKTWVNPQFKTIFMNRITEAINTPSRQRDAKLSELMQLAVSHPSQKEALQAEFFESFTEQVGGKLERIKADIELKEKMKEISEIISLSYISKKYFGKTRAWLYHRINGNLVNGKPASFTREEVDKLQFALKDIAEKIGGMRVG